MPIKFLTILPISHRNTRKDSGVYLNSKTRGDFGWHTRKNSTGLRDIKATPTNGKEKKIVTIRGRTLYTAGRVNQPNQKKAALSKFFSTVQPNSASLMHHRCIKATSLGAVQYINKKVTATIIKRSLVGYFIIKLS